MAITVPVTEAAKQVGAQDVSGDLTSLDPLVQRTLLTPVQYGEVPADRKSTRLNSSHMSESRMPSSA